MTNLQKKMLDLLVEFDGLCRKNGIKYCVCSGCALGLERHDGFIPWDDDIDLFITQDNYKKLCKVFETKLPKNRAWITQDNYPEYENTLVRYADTTTTQLYRSRVDDGSPLGVFLEFFILDPYPGEEEAQNDYKKYLWLYADLNASRYTCANASGYKDVYDKDLYYEYEKRIEEEGKQKVLDEIWNEHLNYKYEDCDLLVTRWGLRFVEIQKEWMENLVYRNFEGAMLPFMKDNMEYLEYAEYGYDWDKLPPKSSRESHPTYTDLNTPYSTKEKEVLEISTRMGLVENIKGSKKTRIKRKFQDLDVQELVAYQIKAYLEAKGEKLTATEDLTRSTENIDNLNTVLSDYIKYQCRRRYYLTKMKADVSDDVLEAILYLQIYKGTIKDMKPILDIYSDRPCVKVYSDAYDTLFKMKLDKYHNNIEEVDECYKKLVKDGFKDSLECERVLIWLMTRNHLNTNEEELLDTYNELLHKDDKEIKKYVGDYYYDSGELDRAYKWYTAAKNSNNGMITLDMYQKGFF